MTRLRQIPPPAWAMIALILLWMLFFWRVLTPIDADKASFKQGDFSGQFVAFGAYQYNRFTEGEIPLWNPYNNSGLPFIADTQAAVFYPPRLLTIAVAHLSGAGWSYHALELEAIAHVLVYTLCMFAFVRRLTDSTWGGLVAAIVGGYGGYLSGYPPLQLALLEAGIWLPLALMGIHDATRDNNVRYIPLMLTGTALGLSWLAGHPQTSWFLTYLTVAYFAYRCWGKSRFTHTLRQIILGTALFGFITLGATAVTFLPGIEYLAQTARAGLGYTAKSNGFPIQDVIQFLYPGVVSLFSPLYVGILGLILALTALRLPPRRTAFWFGVALFGLLLSFGGNTALFPSVYNWLPGLRFFRGQERAAYLVANGLAILSGIGFAGLLRSEVHRNGLIFRRLLLGTMLFTGGVFVLVMLRWFGFREEYGDEIGTVTFTALIAVASYAAGVRLLNRDNAIWVQRAAPLLIIVVLVFDLFSVNMDANSNYDDIPPTQQLSLTPPPLIQPTLPNGDVFRVDGFRGLTDNYGSLYGVYDARGISPLFLDGLYQLQYEPFASTANFETNPVFWELNAVRYVYSGFEELPTEGTIITQGTDRFGAVFLHELADPRPFALLMHNADVVDSDEFARALLADPRFNPRESVILHQQPMLTLPEQTPDSGIATITTFEPETITIAVDTPQNAILSLSHPHYPGWQAALNGEPIDLLRAYGGFSAIEIPAGEHELTLVYRPLSFRIGAVLSILIWAMLGIVGIREIIYAIRK